MGARSTRPSRSLAAFQGCNTSAKAGWHLQKGYRCQSELLLLAFAKDAQAKDAQKEMVGEGAPSHWQRGLGSAHRSDFPELEVILDSVVR